MEIFADIDGKTKQIFGKTVSVDDLYSQLVDVLEIGSGCNLYRVLIKIAKIQIVAVKGFTYFAYVRKRKYIDIMYCRPGAILKNKTGIKVAQFDGDKEEPEILSLVLEKSAFKFWTRLNVICAQEIALLSQKIAAAK